MILFRFHIIFSIPLRAAIKQAVLDGYEGGVIINHLQIGGGQLRHQAEQTESRFENLQIRIDRGIRPNAYDLAFFVGFEHPTEEIIVLSKQIADQMTRDDSRQFLERAKSVRDTKMADYKRIERASNLIPFISEAHGYTWEIIMSKR